MKFQDICGDGPTSNDAPLAGVTIRLYSDRNGNGLIGAADGASIKSMVTSSSGAYAFKNLTPGKYLVGEVSPTGYISTGPKFHAATVSSGSNIKGLNFYNFQIENCKVSNVSFAITRGGVTKVYPTLDGNVWAGDLVKVTFTVPANDSDMVSLVSYNAPNGTFTAADMPKQTVYQQATGTFGPGVHSLSVKVPTGYFQIDFVCGCVISKFGEAGSNVAYTPQKRLLSAGRGIPAGYHMVTGSVFADANGNGKAETSEQRLSNWTVYIDSNANGKMDAGETRALTNAQGRYALIGSNLTASRVKVVAKAGYKTTTPATLPATASRYERLFGVKLI